jgi:hypothetical protein
MHIHFVRVTFEEYSFDCSARSVSKLLVGVQDRMCRWLDFKEQIREYIISVNTSRHVLGTHVYRGSELLFMTSV